MSFYLALFSYSGLFLKEVRRAKMRILIVDDSISAKMVMETQLNTDPEFQGNLSFASDGQEAIELNESIQPELILMDINMPVLDGIEATRQIMSTRPVPIVIMTTDYSKTRIQDCLEAGALEVLGKPELSWGHQDIRDFCAGLKMFALTPLPRHK
jgi:CheY-like chemotaxis protein